MSESDDDDDDLPEEIITMNKNPSPYRLYLTLTTHPVRVPALVALAARALLVTAALYYSIALHCGETTNARPERGPPTGFWKDPLRATRCAIVTHHLVVLLTHALSSRYSNGDAPRAEAEHVPSRPSLLGSLWHSLVALAIGTAFWFVFMCNFGLSALYVPYPTTHASALLASLTFVPGAAMYGTSPWEGKGAQWEWHRVLVLGDGAFYPIDFQWFASAWGAALGAWMGAMPIPLDWGRAWQRWPITVVYGMCVGCVVGAWTGFAWAVAKWARGDRGVFGWGDGSYYARPAHDDDDGSREKEKRLRRNARLAKKRKEKET
jgi:phosphatidylinositol glycan class F